MEDMMYNEFENCVNMYVNEMIKEHLSASGSLPQTIFDYDECMNEVIERGIMGSNGIASVSLTKFYALDIHILDHVHERVYDEVIEVVNEYMSMQDPAVDIDPVNLDAVCETYLRAYVFNNRNLIMEYFMIVCNVLRYLPPSAPLPPQ